MRVAVGADDRSALTDAVRDALRARGHDVIVFGAIEGAAAAWPRVGRAVGEAVASGRADTGVVMCWTATGVSIAANKVRGVRAALCGDAQTAEGARRWNDANVLALSMRATSIPVALEILDAWFSTAASNEPDDQAAITALEPEGNAMGLKLR